jgi:hypothetical protein
LEDRNPVVKRYSFPKFSSKTQADFVRVECGYAANADYIASRIILAAGLAIYASGGVAEPRLPSKQEPSEIAVLTRCYQSPPFQGGKDVNLR